MQSLIHSNHLRLTTLVIVYLLAHLFLLLLQAGDVETNPGPQTPGMHLICNFIQIYIGNFWVSCTWWIQDLLVVRVKISVPQNRLVVLDVVGNGLHL